MDKRYEVYCLADRHFYETPDRIPASRAGAAARPSYEAARRPVPDGWRSARSGDWLHLTPEGGGGLPPQGWKIHVSACLDNAESVAAKVWDYCVPRAIPFKFVPDMRQLHLRNSKYAGRDSSGKFATVYPVGEAQLHTVLRELGGLLEGEQGPYVLTDLRWGEGPLYVRYGAFDQRYCLDDRGTLVLAIEDGDGKLVPDSRDPVFRVPDWVTLPAFLEPHLAARSATTTTDLPYRIERALHFSNGGGVYAGTDTRSGEQVVLKEARPHAGLAADGADAVSRLEREKAALERLTGLGVAPEARDWFTLGGHRFLVMDFLPGRPLNSFFAERHPLIAADPSPEALAEYTEWALRIHREVESAVAAVHSRDVVFTDLHMFNIMVAPDEESVKLLDFEAAAPVEDRPRQIVAHPGFLAPADRTGFGIDQYALACLRLALFLPLTTLLAVDRGKAASLAEAIAAEFPDVPKEFLLEAVEVVEGGTARPTPLAPAGDWPRSRDSMAAGILACATPDRDDRLFPGDIAQFGAGGGLGLAHGAAGVLYALDVTGAGRYEAGEEWLLRHTDPPPRGTPPGLYDGLLGVAYVLDRLGHRQRALDLAETVLSEKWEQLAPGLHGGLAGLGLALDHLADTTGETGLRDAARRASDLLTGRPASRTGLMHGASGPALLWLRQYERTGDPGLLDRAAGALRADLEGCVVDDAGAWQVKDGFRTLPYVAKGSVGIAMVLQEYLAHRADEHFERALAGILPAAHSRFYAQSGLLNGRAGMVLHLSRQKGRDRERLASQIEALDWHAMAYDGHLAFPGDQLMRLSTDLATGTAGCLLALGAAFHTEPVGLPFLPPPGGSPEPAPARPGS